MHRALNRNLKKGWLKNYNNTELKSIRVCRKIICNHEVVKFE